MDHRLTQIEEKLDLIDKKLHGIACIGNPLTLVAEPLSKLEKKFDNTLAKLELKMQKDEDWLKVAEAAVRLDVSEAYLRNELIPAGHFETKRVGVGSLAGGRGELRVSRKSIEEYERKKREG